jgi:hypothetical protein
MGTKRFDIPMHNAFVMRLCQTLRDGMIQGRHGLGCIDKERDGFLVAR